MTSLPSPYELVGAMDIYLLDQVLRARIRPGMRIFEAGCGYGRNLEYFLRAGYDVAAVDTDSEAIAHLRGVAADLACGLPAERFRVEPIESASVEDGWADVVVSSAVLHFAADDEAFAAMLRGSWRALTPGGLFFCRLASDIGMEGRFEALGGRRFRLPDGSERYLVDEPLLFEWTERLGGELVDPLKTTLVQGLRCMTTWVVRDRGPAG